MYKTTKIFIAIGVGIFLSLLTLAIVNAMKGDWVHALCNFLWIGTTVMMIIQIVNSDKLRKENYENREHLYDAKCTINELNRKVWELSECKSCFFGTPDIHGIKCEKHNRYIPGMSYCFDKITKDEIPERAKALRGFVNSVRDDVLLDSVTFNNRPCRFEPKNPDTVLHCQPNSVSDCQPDSVSASQAFSDIN